MSNLCLGKLDAIRSPFLGDLVEYTKGKLPQPPPEVKAPTVTWGMDDNDRLGCCTISGVDHLIGAWDVDLDEHDPRPDDQQIETTYFDLTGGADTGLNEQSVLQTWHTDGLWGNKIAAFAPFNGQKITEMHQAIAFYRGAYLGIQCPQSCQQQFANGEPWTYVEGSPILGGHCVTPNTRVLTADLQWVQIGDVEPGDVLTGFDERVLIPKHRRRYRSATVEAKETLRLPCYELEFEDGTIVTASSDHQWLVAPHSGHGGNGDRRWLTTEQLRPVGPSGTYGSRVTKAFDVWETDASWGAGYLAGAFDGEGWIDGNEKNIHKIGFCQRDNPMLEQTANELKIRGYNFWHGLHNSKSGYSDNPITNLVIHGRNQLVPFLGSIRPPRLLDKFSPDRLGAVHGTHVRLIRKTFKGDQEVTALQTDARTYISEGLLSHNCIVGVGYTPTSVLCVSWGTLVEVTYPFFAHYLDESWAIIGQEIEEHHGDGVGIDLAALLADIAKI